MTNLFNDMWVDQLDQILDDGRHVAPRGLPTKEIPGYQLVVDMRRPVITIPERKLNYRFMVAEALWMLRGQDDVASLSQFNPNIAQFSDDGLKFWGAYGPSIKFQRKHVVDALRNDRETRQATLTTWRANPPKTKDVPCTIAMDFKIRDDLLEMHVYMRSSDAFLGIPHDVFSFAMVAWSIAGELNRAGTKPVAPGLLHLTASSSHLYEDKWEMAKAIVDAETVRCGCAPSELWRDPDVLEAHLDALTKTAKGDLLRWWETAP